MTSIPLSGNLPPEFWSCLTPSPANTSWTSAVARGHLTAKNRGKRAADVVGVDGSPEMIRQAKEKYPALRFEVMDAREISLNETFDAAFSNATLHWIKEPERVISAIKKLLRPGGRFVAEFGGKGNTGELVKAVGHAWESLGLTGSAPHPWYYPSIPEYAGLLEKHGFEVTPRYSLRPPHPAR